MKRMILLDIDGTILKPGEPLNAALLQPHTRRLISAGWTIGLNSGRMMESMTEIYLALDLNGPIIAEFGNHIHWPRFGFECRDFNHEAIVQRAKFELAGRLANAFPNALVVKQHSVSGFPIHNAETNTDIVAIIMPRRYSLFYLCRLATKTGIEYNHRLLRRVTPLARQIFGQYFAGPTLEDVDENFCAHVLYLPNSTKANGVRVLQTNFPAIEQIHMIGDWDIDILPGIENARHYAVANATQRLKSIAVFTADTEYDTGTIECLQAIEQNNCSGSKS